MKPTILILLLLVGCSSITTVSLPLNQEKIEIPSSVGRKYAETYLSGYENSWIAYLKVYAKDIDHEREFMEDIATGDPNYLEGWYTARDDFEELVRELIVEIGKESTIKKLEGALELYYSQSTI